MVRFRFYVLLVAATLLGWTSTAFADTSVHGIVIRTADDAGLPSLRVCTATRSNHWANPGSNDTAVVFCLPTSSGGVRPVSFPEAQAAATLLEETAFFSHDSAELSEKALGAVRIVAIYLMENPTASLTLAGHTDATGSEEYNMELSQRRAERAYGFFLANGALESQIDVEWFGETQLEIDTLKREPTNRRVVFTLWE